MIKDGRILIVVSGEPVAQGRPKFSNRGGFVRTYDPLKSRDFKDYVRLVAQQEMKGKEFLSGALSLSVQVFRSMPKSLSKKKQLQALDGTLRPTTKPDTSNYVKGAEDALEGIVFANDSAIVSYHKPFGKWYSDRPRIEIEVKEI